MVDCFNAEANWIKSQIVSMEVWKYIEEVTISLLIVRKLAAPLLTLDTLTTLILILLIIQIYIYAISNSFKT